MLLYAHINIEELPKMFLKLKTVSGSMKHGLVLAVCEIDLGGRHCEGSCASVGLVWTLQEMSGESI